MTVEVDARGLFCPQPLLAAREALDEIESGTVVVLVDDPTAFINVSRYAEKCGHQVETEQDGEECRITIVKE